MHPQFLSNTYLVRRARRRGLLRRRRRPGRAAHRGGRAPRHDADARPAHPPPPRPRRGARQAHRALARPAGARPPRRARRRRDRRDEPRRDRRRSAACEVARAATRPATPQGMLSLLVEGNVFTGDTLFKNSVGGVRAPGHTTYADLKHSIMDVLLALPPETRHPPRPHRPDDGRRRVGAQPLRARLARARPRGRRAVHRAGRAGHARPARRRLRRRPQGLGALARRLATTSSPGSQVKQRLAAAGERSLACVVVARREKKPIPTSRLRRSATVGRLAAGQAVRQVGTRAANLDALRRGGAEGARAPPARDRRADRRRAGDDEGRGDEARPGDVVPRRRPRPRGVPRGVPGASSPSCATRRRRSRFEDMKKVIEQELDEPLDEVFDDLRPGADRRRLDRPGLPGAPARRPRRRGQGPVPGRRRRRCGPTCRTSG